VNIDFSAHPGFSAYVLLLMVAGVAMLIIASPTVKRQRTLSRVLNAAFGAGFLGYGIYLAFMFKGGHYVIFFQAFILPILLISRTIRGAAASPPPAPSVYPPAAPAQYPPAGLTAYPAAAPAQYSPAQPAMYTTPPPPMAGPAFQDDASGWLSAPVSNGQAVLPTAPSPAVAPPTTD